MAVITCDSCAPGIVNDDWTHLDMACCSKRWSLSEAHSEDCEAERMHASITGTLEVLGWLTHDGEADMPGYFDCAVCNETQCGGGHRFLTNTQGA